MKYAFFTYSGEGLAVALRLLQEGNDVLVGVLEEHEDLKDKNEEHKKRRLRLFDGLLKKYNANELVEKLRKEKPKNWFVVCDFNYLYPVAEKLKKLGFRGLLPTRDDYELEKDRNLAKEFVMKNYKIFSYQEVYEFKTIQEGIEFLKQQEKVFGIKGNNPDAPTFFPFSNNPKIAFVELLDIMESAQKEFEKDGFILEEKIEDLIEFTPECIAFDGEILGMNVDIELKPIGNGNLSYQTGCAADLVMWVEKDSQAWQKLYELFFKPALSKIVRPNEMVIWDASVFYSPSREKFYFGEYCSNRPGYNSWFTELSTFKRVSEFFERIINKQPLFDGETKPISTSVRVFNLLEDKKEKGLPAKDMLLYADINNKNIWLLDVYKKKENLYVCGTDPNVAVLTCSIENREDWKKGFEEIDKKLSNGETFIFPYMYYRKAFDILNNSYYNNLTDRYKFVCEFLGIESENKKVKENQILEILKEIINKL